MNKTEYGKKSRITLMIHHALQKQALEVIKSIGCQSVFAESARTVRIHEKPTIWTILGFEEPIEDSPTDIIRFIVAFDKAEAVALYLINKLDLRIPGRGSVLAQDIFELGGSDVPDLKMDESLCKGNVIHDLTMITGIQSFSATGDNISKVALRHGAGLPTVSLGKGTGIRDRLGLLRITITPEKELTYLLVPSFDANGLQNMLIEKGKLNRPGGGFMYQTHVNCGLVDPLIRVGNQTQTASMEQIVAAIDDLKQNTDWRKRTFENSSERILNSTTTFSHREISFICPVGHSDDYIQTAMDGGAAGATLINMRYISLSDEPRAENKTSTYENAIMCVKNEEADKIIDSIIKLAEEKGEKDWLIQKLPASAIFATYKKK